MKFLCGNCKAKFQIPDEKVVGRTLRMKCRRCNHDILIDGHAMPGAAMPQPAGPPRRVGGGSAVSLIPGPMRVGSGVGPLPARTIPPGPGLARSRPPPSPLGADFRRHVAAPPAVPARTAPYDLWHAAIQDMPVGPMTREELSRKIEAGAVTSESLCWREGMDDWRPLRELAELAALLRRSTLAVPTPPATRGFPRMPPAVPGTSPPRAPAPSDDDESEDEGAEPTRIAGMAGVPAPALGSALRDRPGTATALPQFVGTSAALASARGVEPPAPSGETRPRLSAVALLAIGSFATLVLVVLPWVIVQLRSTPAPVAVAAVAPTDTAPKVAGAEEKVAVKPDAPTAEAEPSAPVAAQAGKARRAGPRAVKAPVPDKPAADEKLSDAERALLARMGGGDTNLGNLGPKEAAGGGKPSGPALTAAQLMKVVQGNRPSLTRCYEAALRSTGGKSSDAIKVTVEVVVGMSGTVTSVNTQGAGLGTMNGCIRQSVKRWRFPQSSDESPFNFPVVFQPGA